MKGQNLKGFLKKGHLNDEALALFADALFYNKEEKLPDLIRNHVEECHQCKKEISALYDILKTDGVIQNIENHPYLDSSEEFEKNSFKINKLLKVAAVILILVGLSSIIYVGLLNRKTSNAKNNLAITKSDSVNKHKDNTTLVVNKDSTAKKPVSPNPLKSASSKKILAKNMQESVLFEGLIASNYRSNDIEVIAPLNKQQFKSLQPIKFMVDGDLSTPVTLIIYTNKGVKKYTKENITATSFSITLKLSPGLYYWKLERENNLIHVGKFVVK